MMEDIIGVDVLDEPRSKGAPKQSRSIATRRKLLVATVKSLVTNGYAGTSMDKVVAIAGVSRGAQVHHFPVKTELLGGALELMLDELVDDMHLQMSQVEAGTKTIADVIYTAWEDHYSRDLFAVTVELVNAARSDAELRSALVPVTARFRRRLDECFGLVRGPNASAVDQRRAMAIDLTMSLLRGIGVQVVLYNHPAHFRAMLDEWLGVLPSLMREKAGD